MECPNKHCGWYATLLMDISCVYNCLFFYWSDPLRSEASGMTLINISVGIMLILCSFHVFDSGFL